jgi:hypothetical protein
LLLISAEQAIFPVFLLEVENKGAMIKIKKDKECDRFEEERTVCRPGLLDNADHDLNFPRNCGRITGPEYPVA